MDMLQEINEYLLKECSEEFPKLPAPDQFTFSRMPHHLADGDVGDKRPPYFSHGQLRLGVSDGEYTSGLPVFLCLGGTGYNEVFLSCQERLYKLTVENLSHVLLDQAYRNLLLSEGDTRAAEEVEKGRLKAWACYSFLRAGQIPTMKPYTRFQDELRYACTWMAREYGVKVVTARQKAALQRKKEEKAKSRLSAQEPGPSSANEYNYQGRANIQSPAATSGTRDQSTNAMEEPRQSALKRENDTDESDEIPPRLSKRRNIDQKLAKLRQGYESFGLDLDAVEREYTDSGNDIKLMRQLKTANSQHVAQIAMLERQLHSQVEETETLQAASREMKEEVRVSAQNAEKERAAREAEAVLRKKAEDRLTEYMDAQKKMAARFG